MLCLYFTEHFGEPRLGDRVANAQVMVSSRDMARGGEQQIGHNQQGFRESGGLSETDIPDRAPITDLEVVEHRNRRSRLCRPLQSPLIQPLLPRLTRNGLDRRPVARLKQSLLLIGRESGNFPRRPNGDLSRLHRINELGNALGKNLSGNAHVGVAHVEGRPL